MPEQPLLTKPLPDLSRFLQTPERKPPAPVVPAPARALDRLAPQLPPLRQRREQLQARGVDGARLQEVDARFTALQQRLWQQGKLLGPVNRQVPPGSADASLDTTRLQTLRDDVRLLNEQMAALLGRCAAEDDTAMLTRLQPFWRLIEGRQRELTAEEERFRTDVRVRHAANGLDCLRQGVTLPPLLGRLAEVTSMPGFDIPRADGAPKPDKVPEGFDSAASAWLFRQQLASGAQAVTLLGPSGVRALPQCADPVWEPVGLDARPPSTELAEARAAAEARRVDGAGPAPTLEQGVSASDALADLAERVVSLPSMAGPVWVVTTAEGIPGAAERVVVPKEERAGGIEFLPWSPQAAYGSAVARFSANLDCAAAQAAFKDITSGLAIRAIGTVTGGKLTHRTIRAFFELLTGGVDRFTKSAVSGVTSLALDITSIALGSGGRKSRIAGAVLDVVRDAPLTAMCDGLRDAGEQISRAAATAQEKLAALCDDLPENLHELPGQAEQFLSNAWTSVKGLFDTVTAGVVRLWSKLQPLWDKISTVFQKVSPYLAKASEHMDTALEVFCENIADLWERIKNLPDLFTGLTGLLQSALEAAASSLPLVALDKLIKQANKWVAEVGGKLFARLNGGPEAFGTAINEFTRHLAQVHTATAQYALSRSVYEVGKPAAGRQIETQQPLLAFRQPTDAFDYALMQVRTEPGDRHVVLSRIDLDDGCGRDLGPLLACSPHHRGQDALLLPGARLQVTGTTVMDTPAGPVVLNLLVEKNRPGTDTGLDVVPTAFDDLSWLKKAPPTGRGAVSHLIDIGTRMHAVTQMSRFVMEYYGGDMERWVREVLGSVAGEVWLAAQDRYEADHVPDGQERWRGWAAEQAVLALGFDKALARLAGDLGSNRPLKDCLRQFRTALEADGQATGRGAKMVIKAVAAAEQALDMYRRRGDAKEKADRAAQLIGVALGVIETLLEVGPRAFVDAVVTAKGPAGAAVRCAIAERVMGREEGRKFIRNIDGDTTAVLADVAAGAVPVVHKTVKTGQEFFSNPVVNSMINVVPAVVATGVKLGGGSAGTAMAGAAGAAAGTRLLKGLFTSDMARAVAEMPEEAVNDASTFAAGAGGWAGRYLADWVSGSSS